MRIAKLGALVFALALIAGAFDSASAAPRQWKDASGQFSVSAELVEVKNGEVHLKKADGEVIVVAASKLSESDRNYLAGRVVARPAAAPPAAAATPAAAVDSTGIIKVADANADGKLSRTEWGSLAQKFRAWDADKDNALDETELEATDEVELVMKLADADGDEKVARAEWAQFAQAFPRLDKGRDGSIDRDELEAAAKSSATRAAGTASLAGNNTRANAGPTVWRGSIEGRGQIELTVTGNQIAGREFRGGGPPGGAPMGGGPQGGLGSGTFTMSGDGRSGNMDAVYTEGPQAGQVCLGIYQLNGDTLTWCVSNRNGQRPQAFTSGGGNWLMVLQRVAMQ
ncbi:MAG: hypothetical protein C0483_21270 [Pirellula sp.]|nr:hypothetical protein [Pirellula sp.]